MKLRYEKLFSELTCCVKKLIAKNGFISSETPSHFLMTPKIQSRQAYQQDSLRRSLYVTTKLRDELSLDSGVSFLVPSYPKTSTAVTG